MIEILFTELIIKYLKSQNKPRIIGIYYPSELPWCLRRLYYDYTIGKDKDLETNLLIVSGVLMHSFIASVLEWASRKKLVIESQSEVSVGYTLEGISIIGKADDMVRIKLGDEPVDYLIEVKSKSKLPDKPRLEHIMQLNFYLYFYPESKGCLLYITRDGFNMRAFETNYSEKLFKELIDRALILHKHLINNTLPEPEYWHGECLNCIYRDICFKQKKSLNSQD
jgi:CRISPR-associated exonuclease Cas4